MKSEIEVPDGWEVMPLGEILDVRTGKKNVQDSIENGKYPFFTRSVETQRINSWSYDCEGLFIAGEGNFSVRYYKGKFELHQRCYLLSALGEKSISIKFLQNAIQIKINNLIRTAVKSTVISLRKPIIGNLKILLPPFPEQQKIADILSKVDEQIDLTEKIIDKTEELKKGLMQKLLTKGIGHKEFKKVKIGPREYDFPASWKVMTFKEICEVRQGLQIAICKRFKENGPNRYPYITVQFLHNKEDEVYFIENPNKNVICNKEDILMTRTGNTGEVITDVDGVFHNNFFLIDYNKDNIFKYFLKYVLESPYYQKIIMAKAGTTTIPDLNHGDFYSIPFVFPNYEEQKQIASILSKVDEQIQGNKKELNHLKEVKKGLMQDLLTGKVRVSV